jgi:hypothetical protein
VWLKFKAMAWKMVLADVHVSSLSGLRVACHPRKPFRGGFGSGLPDGTSIFKPKIQILVIFWGPWN